MATERDGAPLVLVIDDVSPVVRLIELELQTQGFRTDSVLLAHRPVDAACELQPAAIVLGSSLPAPPVYEVLRELKQRTNIPVLFLHVGGNEADAAHALGMGANDTLSMPFAPEDLGLRLRVLAGESLPEAHQLTRGPLRIDVLRRLVSCKDRQLALGTSEWVLLLALARVPGPISAPDLLAAVWGEEYRSETTFLRLWIGRLRTNIGDDASNPAILLGDEASGYRLVD